MDPLAHTLVGASLSETRLKQLTHLATPTLILAANAPDIDAVTLFVSRDLSLGFRRGWTHGVLSLALLPLLLAGLILLFDRVVARTRGRDPAGARPVVFLAYLGVLTHPCLDWLNTYGIRLLMPFDGRWFYGDALFIIDPWLWLLASVGVVLAHSSSTATRAGWLGLGVVLTALVTGVDDVPGPARLTWLAGAASIVALRVWRAERSRIPQIAAGGLAGALMYIGMMVTGSTLAASQVTEWLSGRGETPSDIMAGPLPANPFVRDVVVVDDRHYHFLQVNWLRDQPIQIAAPSIDKGPTRDDPVVNAARMAPHIRGLMTWIRFPAYKVETLSDGYRVTITDARYALRTGPRLGSAVVELDRDLRVREPG